MKIVIGDTEHDNCKIKFERYPNGNLKLILLIDGNPIIECSKNIDRKLGDKEVFIDNTSGILESLIRYDIVYPYLQYYDITKYGIECGSYRLTMKGLDLTN